MVTELYHTHTHIHTICTKPTLNNHKQNTKVMLIECRNEAAYHQPLRRFLTISTKFYQSKSIIREINFY